MLNDYNHFDHLFLVFIHQIDTVKTRLTRNSESILRLLILTGKGLTTLES